MCLPMHSQDPPRLFVTPMLCVALVISLLLAACGGTSQGSKTTVRAGWVQVLQWTHWADMPKYIQDKNVNVQLNSFDSSNETDSRPCGHM